MGKYHGCDVHAWKDPKTKKKVRCDFHPAKTCTCKKCKNNTKGQEPLCGKGSLYKSKTAIRCPLHSLLYEIETAKRAQQAHDIIHPELGRGNSNLPEASHNVMLRLRSKDVFLSRLHYIVKTDMGLLQSCVTWEQDTKPFGPDFIHWRVELFQRMKLPIPPGMVRSTESALRDRKKHLQAAKTQEGRARRIALKTARVLDSEERKQWTKKRAIQHSYGQAELDADSDDEDNPEETDARAVLQKDSQLIQGKGQKKKAVGRVVGLNGPPRTTCRKRKSQETKGGPRKRRRKTTRQE
ncbi:Hypp6603 [Branchiostoma lanceolatum]|uniref:Hypp6603 protein n=1 Tax=Branchiostoma lanceolatum TaxID=7740 RepID=A0A8J9YV86_BRALA|nr:Hypp6603 [Branchiostoma lanceolatum]